MIRRQLLVVLCFGALLLCACSATENNGGLAGGTATGTGASAAGGSGTGGLNMGGSIGGMNAGGGEPLITEVFGHSSDTLYRLDPVTHEVTVVGTFQGCFDVIDIAIDKNETIIGTTFSGLYRIDKHTAACTHIASGSYPNSLSFVPEGTVDPNEEALVGYYFDEYVRIDTTTGQVTTIGSVGSGFSSSGDIVSVINGGTYLTVNGNGCSDCLLQIDPVTGDLIQNWGHLPYTQVFGLAYWGGAAYGFTNGGDLFEISFGNGVVGTTPIPVPGAPADLSFWGAGSSTAVPVDPPH